MSLKRLHGIKTASRELATPEVAGHKIEAIKGRIPHQQILDALQKSPHGGRSIEEVYRQEVVPFRNRAISLLGKKSPARIIHTLLGYEVQASYKRVHCPDMVTARYLKLFTELGCRRIRMPYDPTATERLIPELESAQHRLISGIRELFPRNRAAQLYVLRNVYRLIRLRLRSI